MTHQTHFDLKYTQDILLFHITWFLYHYTQCLRPKNFESKSLKTNHWQQLGTSHLCKAKAGVVREWILGTPHIRFNGLEYRVWLFISNSRSLRYHLNQAITFFEKRRYFIFFIKIWRLMVSNAIRKSIKIIPVRLFSNPVVILSVRCPRQVLKSVENFAFTQKLLCLVMNNRFNNFW